MADEIRWTGQSGKTYTYLIYTMGTTFTKAPGNYIFARRTQAGTYSAIYIGQTSDLSERFENHHKMSCIKTQSATHICVHTNSGGEAARRAEEEDLLKKGKPPCND